MRHFEGYPSLRGIEDLLDLLDLPHLPKTPHSSQRPNVQSLGKMAAFCLVDMERDGFPIIVKQVDNISEAGCVGWWVPGSRTTMVPEATSASSLCLLRQAPSPQSRYVLLFSASHPRGTNWHMLLVQGGRPLPTRVLCIQLWIVYSPCAGLRLFTYPLNIIVRCVYTVTDGGFCKK